MRITGVQKHQADRHTGTAEKSVANGIAALNGSGYLENNQNPSFHIYDWSSSKTEGVVYQNTIGRPIFVYLSGDYNTTNDIMSLHVSEDNFVADDTYIISDVLTSQINTTRSLAIIPVNFYWYWNRNVGDANNVAITAIY